MTGRTLQAGKPLSVRWQNAIKRAEKAGVEVYRIEGTNQWFASSASEAGRAYALTVENGDVVGCSCPAVQEWGQTVCVHQAAWRLKHDPGFAARLAREAGQSEMFEGAG